MNRAAGGAMKSTQPLSYPEVNWSWSGSSMVLSSALPIILTPEF